MKLNKWMKIRSFSMASKIAALTNSVCEKEKESKEDVLGLINVVLSFKFPTERRNLVLIGSR